MGRNCLTAQKTDLLDHQHKLETRISSYEQHILYIMKLNDDVWWSSQSGKRPEFPQPEETFGEYIVDYPEDWFTPESEQIMLPSALGPGKIGRLSLGDIMKVEAELCKGQINDSLDGLRLALGEKSLCF